MIRPDVIKAMKKAVDSDFPNVARSLLAEHPDLLDTKLPGVPENSWLHWAAMKGAVSVARILLDSGISANVVNKKKETPLHLLGSMASTIPNADWVANLLISRGADPNGVRSEQTTSPLHTAIYHPAASKVVAVLINHGADVEIRDWENKTPLMSAIDGSNVTAVKQLLSAGTDVFAKGGKLGDKILEDTPLRMARDRRSMEMKLGTPITAVAGPAGEIVELLSSYINATLASQAVDEVNQLSAAETIRPIA